jgi:hypothetical protein
MIIETQSSDTFYEKRFYTNCVFEDQADLPNAIAALSRYFVRWGVPTKALNWYCVPDIRTVGITLFVEYTLTFDDLIRRV